jgi:putative methionine-R-sulfoxide reductase with GAF domain
MAKDTAPGWYRRRDALRPAVEYLSSSSPAFNWLGIDLLKGDSLELGPFVGVVTPALSLMRVCSVQPCRHFAW